MQRVKNAQVLNAQVIKQDNVSETIIILKRNKVSTMMTTEAKADYYSNQFDEVDTAAAYWWLLKKTSGTTKVNREAHQLKRTMGTLQQMTPKRQLCQTIISAASC